MKRKNTDSTPAPLVPHPKESLKKTQTVALQSEAATRHLLHQATWTVGSPDFTEKVLTMAPLIEESNPRDPLEYMLLVQMTALHNLAMKSAAIASSEAPTHIIDQVVSRLTKLTKAYALHMETLDRHRGKGQQRVTVEHVNIHSGGQAIVGVVPRRKGGGPKA